MEYPLKRSLKKKVIIIKMTDAEHEAIRDNADRHTSGNVSQWIRKASISYEPAGVLEDQ